MDMSEINPPVTCQLTEERLRERRVEVRREIVARVVETRELSDGYLLRFPREPEIVDRLARFIEFESVCCPFLTFTLQVEANAGSVSLSLTGPEGTKQFLRAGLEESQG